MNKKKDLDIGGARVFRDPELLIIRDVGLAISEKVERLSYIQWCLQAFEDNNQMANMRKLVKKFCKESSKALRRG